MRPISRPARGKVCQEGCIIRTAGAFLLSLLLAASLIGCGSKRKPKSRKNEKETPAERREILTGSGEFTRHDKEDPRIHLWTIHWERSDINYTDNKNFGGSAEQVTGTIFHENSPVSTFQADTAVMDKASDLLKLDGHVQITSLVYKTVLRCDHLIGSSKGNVIKAKGNLSVESPEYEMTGADELWTTTDMKKVSTPDMFNKL